MAIVSVVKAVSGQPASSAENNKIIDNVVDLDGRTSTLESRTTNASTGNTQLGTRMTAVETKNTNQDAAITSLQDRPYIRYDLTSQAVVKNGSTYIWLTFDSGTDTNTSAVSPSTNFFVLKKAGKWLVTVGLTTSGAQSPAGTYKVQLSANLTGTSGTTYSAYSSAYNESGALPIPPITKVVKSDGTGQIGARVLVPADATFSGGAANFIEMTYLGP